MVHKSESKNIGYWEATSIGIGGMVGGGIFAVLGLSVQLTHGGAPLAFLLAGIVALVTFYSAGLLTTSANILLWISYMVMLSLYSYAFGSYGASLFPPAYLETWKHILISTSIIGIAGLDLLSAKFIGDVEDWIVLINLLILGVFIAVGIWGMHGAWLAPTCICDPMPHGTHRPPVAVTMRPYPIWQNCSGC
jgi:amino acid transporter